jgi:hypothetical protein
MLKKRLLSRSRDPDMTLPDERYRAVIQTRRFLMDLCNPEHTPRVPKLIRDTARSMLRHYPSDFDMQLAARHSPDIFAEKMEDLHRFITKGSQEIQAAQRDKDKREFIKTLK